MEEKKIEIITKNSDGLYNKVTVYKLEDGSLNTTGGEVGNTLLEGDIPFVDTSSLQELDLGDGCEHGKIYADIQEDHEDFDDLEDLSRDAGSYLDETEGSLSEEEKEDRESFIDNMTKDN